MCSAQASACLAVRARRRAWQATINAAAVRDYQPNDPYRWIHWPTTARMDELMIRQLENPWQRRGLVLLDTRAQVYDENGEGSGERRFIGLFAAAG